MNKNSLKPYNNMSKDVKQCLLNFQHEKYERILTREIEQSIGRAILLNRVLRDTIYLIKNFPTSYRAEEQVEDVKTIVDKMHDEIRRSTDLTMQIEDSLAEFLQEVD